MKRSAVLFFVAMCVASAASAQSTFYYCNKGGKKLVSDTPCDRHGAKESKRVDARDLYPISSADGLSDGARRRAQQVTDKLRSQEWQHQQRMQAAAENYGWQQERKKETCDNLYREKEQVVSWLRQRSTPSLNERHRQINNRIYENGC